jgi:hypothetical protein
LVDIPFADVDSWEMNYCLIGPILVESARLDFEGKLKAVAEEQGKATETLHFGAWDGEVAYGSLRYDHNALGAMRSRRGECRLPN